MKGSIVTRSVKDGSKRYLAVWRTPSGKQRWKTFQRRKDAEKFLITTVRTVHDGTYSEVRPMLMHDVFNGWLTHLETQENLGHIKHSTSRGNRKLMERYLRPVFEEHRSDQLTAEAVNTWINALAKRVAQKDLAPKTYNHIITLMKAILKWGRRSDQRYLRHDPMEHVERLPKQQTERDVLEPHELWQLLKAAEQRPPADVILKVAALSGLRRGELFGLQWGDVQRDQDGGGRLFIRRSIVLGRVTTPKTPGSYRVVDIPQILVEELLLYRTAYPPQSEWIFPNKNGTWQDGDNWSKRVFLPLVQGIGLRRIGLHVLRHGYVSLLISQGTDIKYISRQVGHSTIQMTLDVYGHLFKETSRTAMNRLDQRLRLGLVDEVSTDAVSNNHLTKQARTSENDTQNDTTLIEHNLLRDQTKMRLAVTS